MKKLVLALVVLTLLITACSGNPNPQPAQDTPQTTESQQNNTQPPKPTEAPENTDQSSLSSLDDNIKIQKVDEDEIANYKADLPQINPEQDKFDVAVMETSMGTMKFVLYPQHSPKAVENFIGLSEKGYYDGLAFHNIIPNIAVQGGDPEGNGTGGESLWGEPFEAEISPNLHHFRGAISLSNGGDGMNQSQFFIVAGKTISPEMSAELDAISANPDQIMSTPNGDNYRIGDLLQEEAINFYKQNGGAPELDYYYTVFGQMIEGFEVLDAMASAPVDESGCPLEPITITKITIQRKAIE